MRVIKTFSIFLANHFLSNVASVTAELLQAREIHKPVAQCTLKSTPPAGAICGVHGKANSDPKSVNVLVGIAHDIYECQRWCYNTNAAIGQNYDPECQTISYTANSRICRTYKSTIDQIQFKNSTKSPEIFYEESCFECVSPCAQKAGTNLLYNSGFENDRTLIGPWIPYGKDRIVKGFQSHNALKLIDAGAYQAVGICPGRLYYFSVDINPKAVPFYSFMNIAGRQVIAISRRSNASTDWKSFGATFRLGTAEADDTGGTGGNLLSFSYGGGYEVDNVKLYAADQARPVISGDNIISNGGFEHIANGTRESIKPWHVEPYDVYSYDVFLVTRPGLTEGEYKLEFRSDLIPDYDYYTGDYQGYVNFGIKQKVSLQKGKWYRFSLDYMTYQQPYVDAPLRVEIGAYRFGPFRSRDTVHHLSMNFLATSHSATVIIRCNGEYVYGSNGSHPNEAYDFNFFLDNVQLYEIASL